MTTHVIYLAHVLICVIFPSKENFIATEEKIAPIVYACTCVPAPLINMPPSLNPSQYMKFFSSFVFYNQP